MERVLNLTDATHLLELKKENATGEWEHYARFSFLREYWFRVTKETYDALERTIHTGRHPAFQLNITETVR